MSDLDHILLEQLNSAKRSRRQALRIKRIMKNDPELVKLLYNNQKRIQFYETYIEDKTLLDKKVKKTKKNKTDILSRNPVYLWYRNLFFVTNLSYRMFSDSFQSYLSLFKKGK
jgi:hypothetical protein